MNKVETLLTDIEVNMAILQKLQNQRQAIVTRQKEVEDGVTLNTATTSEMETLDKAITARYSKLYGSAHIILKSQVMAHAKINPETKRQNRPVIATVQGSKEYEIKSHEVYGLSCSCPSWVYNQRRDRTCKHTDKVEKYVRVI
jgi:hypothetical protein